MAFVRALAGSAEALANEVRARLEAGSVVAIPTDTVYGLAANPRSEKGIAEILRLKGRDDGKSLPVIFAARGDLASLGVVAPAELLDRLFEVWPAPLTAILPIGAAMAASRGGLTLAVRLPDHPALVSLLVRTGPVTATSANRAGRPPARTAQETARTFASENLLVLDGGASTRSLPSTIVDFTSDPPRVLRHGSWEQSVTYWEGNS